MARFLYRCLLAIIFLNLKISAFYACFSRRTPSDLTALLYKAMQMQSALRPISDRPQPVTCNVFLPPSTMEVNNMLVSHTARQTYHFSARLQLVAIVAAK